MVFLALVVCHGVRESKNEAEDAGVHPEELESEKVHESENTPSYWSEVEACPENKGISSSHLIAGLWIVVTLENPFLLPKLI